VSSLWQLAILSNRAPMTNYYLIIHSHSFKSRGCGRCHSISLVIDRLRSCSYDYCLLNHSFSPINRVHSPRTSHAPMPSYLVIHSHSFTNFGCGSYSHSCTPRSCRWLISTGTQSQPSTHGTPSTSRAPVTSKYQDGAGWPLQPDHCLRASPRSS
jgi:hypothetical protein